MNGENNSETYELGISSTMSTKRHEMKCTVGFEAYVPPSNRFRSDVGDSIMQNGHGAKFTGHHRFLRPFAQSVQSVLRQSPRLPVQVSKATEGRCQTLMKKDSRDPSACFVSTLAVRVQRLAPCGIMPLISVPLGSSG